MEKFLALLPERQQTILDAAMEVFSRMGYKKAYVSEIAQEAGISKAMVFYYFGSKKNLYLYLLEYAHKEVVAAFDTLPAPEETDFFDRILESMKIKISFLKTHPALLRFVLSVYTENEPEVAQEIQRYREKSAHFREELVLTSLDRKKFKDSVDYLLVHKLLTQYAKGYSEVSPLQGRPLFDDMAREFSATMEMLRRNFYKEEFLV